MRLIDFFESNQIADGDHSHLLHTEELVDDNLCSSSLASDSCLLISSYFIVDATVETLVYQLIVDQKAFLEFR